MRSSLQVRVAFAMVAIVGSVCGGFAFGVLVASDRVEDELLHEMTEREAQEFADAYQTAGPIALPSSAYVRSVVVSGPNDPALPPSLRELPPGHHDDIDWGEGVYHVYRRPLGDRWLYLAYEMTAIERRQDIFKGLIWLGVVLALVVAAVAGMLAARLTLAPIARLAARVRHLPAEARGQRLALTSDTPETATIAHAFDRYLARLDDLIERERAFTTDASHELRTPLAVIRSSAELLATQAADERTRDKIDRIRRAADQMTELIEALLLLAREEMPAEHVDLESLVREIVTGPGIPPEGQERIRLEIDSPLEVRAPRAAVSTVIHNLLRNALRHAPDGPVDIRLQRRRLEVIDQGPGMPGTMHDTAFERGFQAGPAAGLGFGLYISKRLCDRFGWQIRLAAAQPRGTRAILRF